LSCPGAARRGGSVSPPDVVPGGGRRFGRDSRLVARRRFLEIYARGQRVSRPFFVLFALPGAGSVSRLGITATKKFGGAVERNRFKRVVRELFRANRATGAPIDLVVNAKAAAKRARRAELDAAFVSGLAEVARRMGR
jgi:ribonuclease P protein component